MTTIRNSAIPSNDAYAQLVDAVADQGLVLLDANAQILSWNRGAEVITGFVSDEVIGVPLFALWGGNARQVSSIPNSPAALNSQPLWDVEVPILQRTTEEVLVRIRFSRIRTSQAIDGSAAWWTVVFQKATSLSSHTQDSKSDAVHSIWRRFIDLADAIPQIVWTAEPNGAINHLNGRASEYCGISMDGLTGWSWENVIHPDDLSGMVKAWENVIRTGIPSDIHFRIRRSDGQYRWHIGRQFAGRDDDGTINQWYGTCTDIEDLRQSQAALLESEQRFRSAFEHSGIGIALADLEGKLMQVNPALCQTLGYTAAELRSLDFVAITHPDDLQVDLESIQRLLRGTGDSCCHVKRYIRKDGSIVWGQLNLSLLRAPDGSPIHFIGQVQDITLQKAQSEALRESEQRLRNTLSAARMGTFDWDAVTNNIVWSNFHYTLFGYPADSNFPVNIKHFTDRIHPEDLERLMDALEQAKINHLDHDQEFRVVHPSGEIRWIHGTGQFFYDANGNPLRMLGTVQDITDAKRAEQAILENERKFRVLAEYYLDSVFILDPEDPAVPLRILYVNSAIESTHGYKAEELIGRSILEIDTPATAAQAKERADRIQSGQVIQFEASHHHRNGKLIPIEVKAGLIPWDGRNVILGINRDISERKRMEQIMLWQNRVLERIATGSSLADTLDEIVDLVESQIPGATCSIMLLWEDDRSRIRFASGRNLPAEYTAAFNGAVVGPTTGSCGTAIYSGKPVISSDIASDPLWEGFAEVPLAFGLRACWSVPIFAPLTETGSNQQQVLGAFGLYHKVPTTPTSQDLAIVEAAAHLAGVAIGRDRSLKAVRDSELRYGVISEITRSVTFGLHVFPDGKMSVDWCRPRFGLLSGYTQQEVNGASPAMLFHPDDRKRFREFVSRILSGEVVREEIRYLTKRGETLNVLLNGKLLEQPSADGNAKIIGGILDITDLKLAQESLRLSEERFKLAVNGSNDGLWDWDVKTDAAYFSPRWKSMLGYDESELEPHFRTWSDLLHPDDKKEAEARAVAFKNGKNVSYESEFRLRCKQGGYRTILSRGFAIRDPQGKAIRMVGTHLDITERKATENALRQSEEKLRLAQSIAQLGNWTYRAVDGLWLASPQSEKICGIPTGRYRPEELLALVHPDDFEAVQKFWMSAMRPGTHECEYRLWVAGELKWVHVWATPEYDPVSKTTVVNGITQDITARRALEEQFQQSQKMDAVGQLAGGVAHDFNNLLTVILGYCNLLLEQLPAEDFARRSATSIKEAGERAASLTRQLLAFSRKQMLTPELISLNELLLKSETMMRRLIRENVIIQFNLAPQLRVIKADPTQIDQVILNVILNARDAMPDGGSLAIETANLELADVRRFSDVDLPTGQYVRLSISDSGCGMPHDVMSRIFEPFYTTKRVGKGTGLGLSVVHGIVNQSGGHIRVSSSVGLGSRFDFYFPASQEESQVKTVHPDNASTVRGHETILLAEDEPVVRQMVRYTLEAHGYNVIEAENGKHALELSAEFGSPIHLLLTDVVMPEMGGRQLAAVLRERRPGIQVVFMSGYIADDSFLSEQNEESEFFLQKPFSSRTLVQKIRFALELSS
ncbi:MAG: PAS domain S-box protein [Planctomycetaceae bacterium]